MTNKQRSQLSILIAAVKRLVLTTCLLVLPATIQSCTLPAQSIDITGSKNMQSKDEKMKFIFADDETEEAAQKKLVQTFPVGSDISKFISAME
jgi:signal transduction histidine kinase